MNKVIKRISATAMAFTLLFTGTAVSKTINPKASTTITASAATACPRHNGTTTDYSYEDGGVIWLGSTPYYTTIEYKTVRCAVCKTVLQNTYRIYLDPVPNGGIIY